MIKATCDNFDSLIASGIVLVDFWATWCMPCKLLSKQLDAVEPETEVPIVKVEIEECPDLAIKYNIMSVPTVILFKDGQPVKETTGYRSKSEILSFIKI